MATIYSRDIPLSPRHLDVLELAREGLTNQQIGIKLGISLLTTKNHMCECMYRLNACNRAEAVVKAIRLGYISLESKGEQIDYNT